MQSLNKALLISAILCSTSVGGANSYQHPHSASQPTPIPDTPSWEESLHSNGVRSPRRLIPKLFRTENRWEALELVRGLRGGAASGGGGITWNDASEMDLNGLDRALRSVSLWLAGIVSWQVMATIAGQHEDLIREVCVCVSANYDTNTIVNSVYILALSFLANLAIPFHTDC